MNKERDRLLKQMEKLARCKANDAVKLAFLDKGGVEIQLVDRLAALRLLVELSDGQESQQAAEFFQAWERKAGQGEREES